MVYADDAVQNFMGKNSFDLSMNRDGMNRLSVRVKGFLNKYLLSMLMKCNI